MTYEVIFFTERFDDWLIVFNSGSSLLCPRRSQREDCHRESGGCVIGFGFGVDAMPANWFSTVKIRPPAGRTRTPKLCCANIPERPSPLSMPSMFQDTMVIAMILQTWPDDLSMNYTTHVFPVLRGILAFNHWYIMCMVDPYNARCWFLNASSN